MYLRQVSGLTLTLTLYLNEINHLKSATCHYPLPTHFVWLLVAYILQSTFFLLLIWTLTLLNQRSDISGITVNPVSFEICYVTLTVTYSTKPLSDKAAAGLVSLISDIISIRCCSCHLRISSSGIFCTNHVFHGYLSGEYKFIWNFLCTIPFFYLRDVNSLAGQWNLHGDNFDLGLSVENSKHDPA